MGLDFNVVSISITLFLDAMEAILFNSADDVRFLPTLPFWFVLLLPPPREVGAPDDDSLKTLFC